MHEPQASRAESSSTPEPLRVRARARQCTPRTFGAFFAISFLAGAVACAGAPEPNPPAATDPALGSVEQDLSTATCRRDLRGCLSSASGVSDLGQCTLEFEGCFTQAALDGLGQGQLLRECRTSADDCLSGAFDRLDINACGEVLGDCADDALDPVRGVFPLVEPLISRVLTVGGRTIRGVVDVVDVVPAIALNGVRDCRDQVVTCLDDAVGDLDISSCAGGLDVCVDGVVDIIEPVAASVDPILDPLPGPNVGEVLDGTEDCRVAAKDCLVGALDLIDIRACGDVLGACVEDATVILDDTVEDVNEIIDPLPVALPKPSNAVDCTLELTQCLAGLNNPFDCAEQAQQCATQ